MFMEARKSRLHKSVNERLPQLGMGGMGRLNAMRASAPAALATRCGGWKCKKPKLSGFALTYRQTRTIKPPEEPLRRHSASTERLAHVRRNLRPQGLNGSHQLGMVKHADGHLDHEAVKAEGLVRREDLVRHLGRAAHKKGTASASGHIELCAVGRRPTALPSDPVHYLGLPGIGGSRGPPAALPSDPVHYLGLRSIECIGGLLAGGGDEAMHIDGRLQGGWIVARALRCLAIEVEQGSKARWLAPDDGQSQWQS